MLQVFDLFGFGDGVLSAGDLPHSGRQGRKPSENYLDVENEATSWSESFCVVLTKALYTLPKTQVRHIFMSKAAESS